MRPPKQVLMVDADPLGASVRAFVFMTRGYAVTQVAALEEMVQAVEGCRFDVLVLGDVVMKRPSTEMAVAGSSGPYDLPMSLGAVHATAPEMQVLMLYREPWIEVPHVDVFLPRTAEAAELLERVRVMCARKRGPKKKPAASVADPARELEVAHA